MIHTFLKDVARLGNEETPTQSEKPYSTVKALV